MTDKEIKVECLKLALELKDDSSLTLKRITEELFRIVDNATDSTEEIESLTRGFKSYIEPLMLLDKAQCGQIKYTKAVDVAIETALVIGEILSKKSEGLRASLL